MDQIVARNLEETNQHLLGSPGDRLTFPFECLGTRSWQHSYPAQAYSLTGLEKVSLSPRLDGVIEGDCIAVYRRCATSIT